MTRSKRISHKLFTQYLSGKLSDEELAQARLSKEDLESIRLVKQQLDGAKRKTPLLMGKAWAQVEQACKPLAVTPSIRRSLKPYLRYAAAAAVLLFATATMLILRNGEDNRLIADQHSGKNKPSAYLELSDGQVVDLQAAGNRNISGDGMDIQLSQQSILYTSNGTLADNRLNTLKVPSKGEYSITLSDGTVAWLNSESELIFPVNFGSGDRRVRLTGEAYFEVSKRKDSHFIIETQKGDIEVLGTSFNVSSYDDDKQWHVTLVTGTVDVTTKVDGVEQQIRLKPSQQLMLENNGKPKVRTVDTQLYTSWREGVFAFENMPLNEIAMHLERWYDVQIVFKDSISASERYTGIFRKNEAVGNIVNTILNANKVSLQQDGNQINIWARSNMR